jgi:hypothetical protein
MVWFGASQALNSHAITQRHAHEYRIPGLPEPSSGTVRKSNSLCLLELRQAHPHFQKYQAESSSLYFRAGLTSFDHLYQITQEEHQCLVDTNGIPQFALDVTE